MLDNVNRYPPHTRAADYRLRFGRRFWPQAALDRDWRGWARELFLDAQPGRRPGPRCTTAPPHGRGDGTICPRRRGSRGTFPAVYPSDFGQLSVAVLLDEYGGPPEEQSALNLVYLLGYYDSAPSGRQPRSYPQLSGTDEKWHIRGGNDQVISGLRDRLPPGSIHLGERLVSPLHQQARERDVHLYFSSGAAAARGSRQAFVSASPAVYPAPGG